MLEKTCNVLQTSIQLSVSLFKAAAMSIPPIILLEQVTEIPTKNLPEEIAKGNVKACVIAAAGFLSVGSILSYKFLQMLLPEKIKIKVIDEEALDEEALSVNHSYTLNKSSEKYLYPKLFFHISTGIIYTSLDILLPVYVFNNFLNYHKIDRTSFYLISVPLNGIGAVTLLIQDIRLIAAMLKKSSSFFKMLADDLEKFRESTLGISIEAYATVYRTVASKMGLYLMMNNAAFQNNTVIKNLLSFQVYNPLTFYCKFSNNQTDLSKSEFLNLPEKLRAIFLAMIFTGSYAIEDCAQYVLQLEKFTNTNINITNVLYGTAATLEAIAYFPKSLQVAQSTINKIAHTCAPKLSACLNISFFGIPKTRHPTLLCDEKEFDYSQKNGNS